MKAVRMHEAKTHFSSLIRDVERGEEIVVYRGSEPVAKLVPFVARAARTPGALQGAIHMAADFDATPEAFGDLLG